MFSLNPLTSSSLPFWSLLSKDKLKRITKEISKMKTFMQHSSTFGTQSAWTYGAFLNL